jgi:hypothetical protein
MRILTIAAFAFTLTGCATAVYDSLDRRGVDARTILIERTGEFRSDALAAKAAVEKAEATLAAIDGLDGGALARRIDSARADGQSAALAAQDFRLSADSLKAACARYFGAREEELALMKTSEESLRAAQADLDASRAAYRTLLSAIDSSILRLSPALILYDAEVAALRKSPTSGVGASARLEERNAASASTKEAGVGLAATIAAADAFVGTLK